jgi:carboxyl-terminal processing protease
LILASCAPKQAGSDVVLDKDDLEDNAGAEDKDHDFVWQYLDEWSFPAFEAAKMQRVEILFRDNYFEDIPDAKTTANAVADMFIKDYYDTTDLKDPTKVTDALLYCYVEVVADKYSYYRTPPQYSDYQGNLSGNFVGIGITATYDKVNNAILVVSVLEDSPAIKAGLKVGDLIISVDGITVNSENYQTAIDAIKGEAGKAVSLTVVRDGFTTDYSIVRATVVERSVTYSLSEDKIGYIRIKSFKSNTDEQFKEAIDYMLDSGAKGIIYDLRSNGGGYLESVENMLDYIAPRGTKLVSFSNDYKSPYVAKTSHTVSLPTTVICNKNTASAAELFTAGIRDLSNMGYFPAKIVGATTYGKGIVQTTYTLADKSAITMTVAYYNPPSGENYNGVGIKPDVEIGMGATGDAQLDAANEEIRKLLQ